MFLLLTQTHCYLHIMLNSSIWVQAVAVTSEADRLQAGVLDSDSCSGSNSSFLVHEKLMSMDTMNSDVTGTVTLCIYMVPFRFGKI